MQKIICKNCRNWWNTYSGHDDIYLCHECGYDNKSDAFNMSKLSKWWLNQKYFVADLLKITKNKN